MGAEDRLKRVLFLEGFVHALSKMVEEIKFFLKGRNPRSLYGLRVAADIINTLHYNAREELNRIEKERLVEQGLPPDDQTGPPARD